jgi:SAM-dependent methyltransferase
LSWTNFDVSPSLRAQRVPILGVLGRMRGPKFPSNVRYGDIVKGLPVPPQSCAAVYCSHVLEHLALKDFEIALANTHKCLKPAGIFRFVLPDLEKLAKDYVNATDPQAALRFMQETYLGVKERERGLIGMIRPIIGNAYHLWMWDYKAMVPYLERAGFTNIRRAAFGDSADPMFKDVEDPGRWEGQLGVECVAGENRQQPR